jgi:hypothetical protein
MCEGIHSHEFKRVNDTHHTPGLTCSRSQTMRSSSVMSSLSSSMLVSAAAVVVVVVVVVLVASVAMVPVFCSSSAG